MKKMTRTEKLVQEYRAKVMQRLEDNYEKDTTFGDRVADRIASFGGSWKFIGCFSSFLLCWLIWNSVPLLPHFDPAPFILLNLILSFVASFQAPIIMMSQNRHGEREKQEAIINYAITVKAESEITELQKQLEVVLSELAEIKQRLPKE